MIIRKFDELSDIEAVKSIMIDNVSYPRRALHTAHFPTAP